MACHTKLLKMAHHMTGSSCVTIWFDILLPIHRVRSVMLKDVLMSWPSQKRSWLRGGGGGGGKVMLCWVMLDAMALDSWRGTNL